MRGLGEEEGNTPKPPSHQITPVDLEQDLYLSDSSMSDLGGLSPSGESTSSVASQPDSNQSPPHDDLPLVIPSRDKKEADDLIHPPENLHQGILRVGADLEALVALNNKVKPHDQLAMLHEIHVKINNFMAPYRLYQG